MLGAFQEKLLVIILRRIKGACREYLSHYRFFKLTGLVQVFFRFFCLFFLGGEMVKNRGSILRTPVHKGSSGVSGINLPPKHFQQLGIGDCLRVISDLNGLIMARFSGSYLLVRGINHTTAGISGLHLEHALVLEKRRFHAPEAASGKSGCGCVGLSHKDFLPGPGWLNPQRTGCINFTLRVKIPDLYDISINNL